jgi:hypothetical protein
VFLDNGAWVHRTFAGKHAPTLDFVLRKDTTDYARLLLRGASNQVNCPTAGIGLIVEQPRINFHPFAHGESSVARFFGGGQF